MRPTSCAAPTSSSRPIACTDTSAASARPPVTSSPFPKPTPMKCAASSTSPASPKSPPASPCRPVLAAALFFVGSMDWLPNVDGVLYFVREILPLIRQARPETTLAIVGPPPPPQNRPLAAAPPPPKLAHRAAAAPRIQVPGTVPDIRPYLWSSAVAIVPLRIGGGTRLKIYEAMAAHIPVVSTTIGAEGLSVN